MIRTGGIGKSSSEIPVMLFCTDLDRKIERAEVGTRSNIKILNSILKRAFVPYI